jgi:hypothetical protein
MITTAFDLEKNQANRGLVCEEFGVLSMTLYVMRTHSLRKWLFFFGY